MYRVLIADDEPIERMVVSKTILRYFPGQLEIVEAVNGREAVELFEARQCHIAILDIEMPGINGLTAAEMIREKHRESSIIFLTAFDDFSYAKRAIAVRALDYLLKPGADEELVAVLEEAIRLTKDLEWKQNLTLMAGTQSTEAESSAIEPEDSIEKFRIHAVAENIRLYIEKHYMEDISLQDAAAQLNYSDAYFCKIFKQCFDRSFVSYLTWFRMEKAKKMLADVLINVKDVSIKSGYRDSNYFAKVFKRVVGQTPSEYRLQVLQEHKGR